MARGSTSSRSTGGSSRSQAVNTNIDFDENDEGEREISGGIGFEVGGGRSNSINPAGASPLSPSGLPARSPSSGGIDLGKGGRGIDLGKEAASDLGRKPPGRGGGIGIEIGASPAGNLGIGISVPLGASPFQARGGIIIDPETGEVSGGSVGVGAGIGPLGASVDVGVDEGGCIQFVTIGVGPFSRTFQKNVCEPNEPPKPPPSPPDGGGGWTPWTPSSSNRWESENQSPGVGSRENPPKLPSSLKPPQGEGGCYWSIDISLSSGIPNGSNAFYSDFSNWNGDRYIYYFDNGPGWTNLGIKLQTNEPPSAIFGYVTFQNSYQYVGQARILKAYLRKVSGPPTCQPPSPSSSPSPFPSPLPNTPPRKNKMTDACCKYLAALLQQVLIILGQPLDKDGGIAEPKKGQFFPFEIKRIATPKNPKDPHKTEKIHFDNYYDLLTYVLNQGINLDVALDPQGIDLIPNGTPMMNQKYERPTDITLKENKEPIQDKQGNDRELKVGDKIFFPSMLAEQRYIFESIRRLEYLFPAGELADAKISKDLLIPGQKGELKIFNLIHAYEILLQYLSAILGDPREQIILKDVNPAKPGDQGVKFGHQSVSHLIRELYKFSLDTAGDVDALMMMGLRDFRTNLANRIQIVQIAEIVEALLEDSGMLEKQQYIKLALEGDPYAGQYVEGKGFEPQPELDADTEEATEKILEKTLSNFTMKVKVSKRSPQEKADIRDLMVQLAKHFERQNAIPATEKAIQDKIDNAEFGIALDRALNRQDIKAAAASSRPRTRRKKKK